MAGDDSLMVVSGEVSRSVTSGRWWQRPPGTRQRDWRVVMVSAIAVSVWAMMLSAWGLRQVAELGLWTELPVALVAMVGTALMPQPVLRDRGRFIGVLLAAIMAGLLSFGVHYSVLAAVMVPLAVGYAFRARWVQTHTLSPAIFNMFAYAVWVSGTAVVVVMLPWVQSSGAAGAHLPHLPYDWSLAVGVAMIAAAVTQVVFTHRWRWLVTVPLTAGFAMILPLPPPDVLAVLPYGIGNQGFAMYTGMLLATLVYVLGARALQLDRSADRTGRSLMMLAEGMVVIPAFIIPGWLVRNATIAVLPLPVVVLLVTVAFWVTAVAFIVIGRAAQHRRAFAAYRHFLSDAGDCDGDDAMESLQQVVESAFQHLATGCDVTHAMVVLAPTQYRAGRVFVADRMSAHTAITAPGVPMTDAGLHHVDTFRRHPAVRSVPLRACDGTVIGELLVASSGLPNSLRVRGGVEGMASLLSTELAVVDQRHNRSVPATWSNVDPFVTDNLMSELLLRQIAAEWSHDTDTGHGTYLAHLRLNSSSGMPVPAEELRATVGAAVMETLGTRPNIVARDTSSGFLVLIPQRFPTDGAARMAYARDHIATQVTRLGVPTAYVDDVLQVGAVVTPRLTPNTADAAIDAALTASTTPVSPPPVVDLTPTADVAVSHAAGPRP